MSSNERYHSIFVDRGPPGGNMRTQRLFLEVTNKEKYRIMKNGLELSTSSLSAIDLENHFPLVMQPPHLSIAAKWDSTSRASGLGNNILGDNNTLILPSEIIDIPCINATSETLAFYGALLLKPGDIIRFPDTTFPLFKMIVESKYIEDFLMTEQGGGFYLEYHLDKPHFHMPIEDGGGYYLLARWNEEKTKLSITGFKLQMNEAVYTKKGVIHCDAALTGNLLVGYDIATDFSTYLLKTADKKRVKIQYHPQK